MPQSGNLGFEAPSLTPPPQSEVKVETYADAAQKNSDKAQMPPVYYGGKAGAGAFLADKLLTGWLAGTKMAQERKAKHMAEEVGAAKTGVDYIGQAYRAAVESGDQQKITETKKALTEAWNDYLNKAEQYAIPDDGGKKKSVGGKVKEGLKRFAQGGENPHINMAHSTLEILRKTDPTQMYGPSKREQQQDKLLDMQTKEMETQQANHDRWSKLAQADPASMDKKDKQFMEFYEYEHFGKTKEQQIKDDLIGKIASGTQLNAQEKQLAEQFGLVKPNQVSAQLRTIADKNGNPVSQIVPITVTPDGQVTAGTPISLPGKDYVGPNQAQLAGQMINAQMSALMKWGAKMHPEWDPKTPDGQKALSTWALTTLYPPTAGTINWADQQQRMDTMNRAIGAVLQKHSSKYKNAETGMPEQKSDEMGSAIMGNIVTTTDDGRYAYVPSLAPGAKEGESHWYNPASWFNDSTEKWSGLTREQLAEQEKKFQAELRAELKKQNPKMPDSYLDQLVPPLATRQQAQAQGLQPPPGAQGRAMEPPPTSAAFAPKKPGTYTVKRPDGSVLADDVTEEEKRFMEADPSGKGLMFDMNTTAAFGIAP